LLLGEDVDPVPPLASLLSDNSEGRAALNATQPANKDAYMRSQLAS
jgi:hypothetical protein